MVIDTVRSDAAPDRPDDAAARRALIASRHIVLVGVDGNGFKHWDRWDRRRHRAASLFQAPDAGAEHAAPSNLEDGIPGTHCKRRCLEAQAVSNNGIEPFWAELATACTVEGVSHVWVTATDFVLERLLLKLFPERDQRWARWEIMEERLREPGTFIVIHEGRIMEGHAP